MDQVIATLESREQEFSDVLEYALKNFGENSESARMLKERRDDYRDRIDVRNTHRTAVRQVEFNPFDFKKHKDSPVMWVILGLILIFAMGGMSTMFVIMMAAKW